MAGRVDVDQLADELSMADLVGWLNYWQEKNRPPGIDDPKAAADLFDSIKKRAMQRARS